MKKFLSLFTLIAALSSTTMAQDDNLRRTDEADYTVIEFLVGGENLDITEVFEMFNMIKADCTNGEHQLLGKKINVVGLQKPSLKPNFMLEEIGLDGTRMFEAVCETPEAIQELGDLLDELDQVVKTKDDLTPEITAQVLAQYYACVKHAPYADDNFDFNDVNSIATALKDLKERYPAKQYIFMANGHGEGWNASDCATFVDPTPDEEEDDFDELEAGKRPAMLFDDNSLDNHGMGLDNLIAAAQQADIHFQLIFDDLCLMATWENLYGYAQIADYAMASVETTTGCVMYPFIQHLSNAGGDAQKLYAEMTDYIQNNEYHEFADYSQFTEAYPTYDEIIASMCESLNGEEPEMVDADIEEDQEEEEPQGLDFQDMGIYDLSKLNTISPILKDIKAWYCQNYSTQQSVIDAAILNAIRNNSGEDIAEEVIAANFDEFFEWLFTNKLEEVFGDVGNLILSRHCQLVFADVVYQTNVMGKQEGTDVSELASLYEQYITALKEMCSLKCSYAPADEPDYVYRTCSPSIIMYQLDPEKIVTKGAKSSDILSWTLVPGLLEASAEAYKATLFDQDIKWSEFLTILEQPVTYPNTHTRQWHLTYDDTDVPTAIQQIGQTSATVSYDLFGRQLTPGANGMSITQGKVQYHQ